MNLHLTKASPDWQLPREQLARANVINLSMSGQKASWSYPCDQGQRISEIALLWWNTMRGQGLCGLLIPWGKPRQELKLGRNLEAGDDAGAMNECFLLPCSLCLALLKAQDHQRRSVPIHNELGLLTSVTNYRNALQACLYPNLHFLIWASFCSLYEVDIN